MKGVPDEGASEPNMGTPEKGHGLSAALFGRVRRAVLALMFLHPAESFYVCEVVRATDVGQGAVQRELKNLASAGILHRERRGQQVHYRANPDCPVYEELRALMVKTAGLAAVLKDALAPFEGDIKAAFVFGSMATGHIDAGSDVDLMIIGEVSFGRVVSELQGAQEQLGREVNPTVYPREEFHRKLADGHQFLSRVMEDPKIFLMGSERDLRAMAQ